MGIRDIQRGGSWKVRGDRSAKKGWGRIGIMGEDEGRVGQVERRRAEFRSFFIPPKKPSPCFLTTPLKKENPFFRQLIKKNLVKKNYLV